MYRKSGYFQIYVMNCVKELSKEDSSNEYQKYQNILCIFGNFLFIKLVCISISYVY